MLVVKILFKNKYNRLRKEKKNYFNLKFLIKKKQIIMFYCYFFMINIDIYIVSELIFREKKKCYP